MARVGLLRQEKENEEIYFRRPSQSTHTPSTSRILFNYEYTQNDIALLQSNVWKRIYFEFS
jgi:hypothetical protein